jgi:hypothetical protein
MAKIYRFGILPLTAGCALFMAVGGNMLAGAERASGPTPVPAAAARARVTAAAASWPLRFEENVGQVRGAEAGDVRYLSRGSAYTLFLTSREAVLLLRQREEGKRAARAAVLRMRVAGGAGAATVVGQDALPGKSNYLIGNDPAQWRTGVPNFGRVAVKGVYPGIDLVYHGNQRQLEYDFEVAARANPAKIRLAMEGARQLRIDANGDLVLQLDGGDLRFRRPVAYQIDGVTKQLVPASYILKGKNQVAFRLAAYDPRRPLVIDPVLAYSTYLGGSNIDVANGIAVAPDGSAFIAGGTFSTDLPTKNPLQANAGGGADFPRDAFVAKVGADGTLAYSTYLGGKGNDVANAIAVDAAGEAFVTGTTTSTNFPVAYGFNLLCGGDGQCGATWNPQGLIVNNAFVTKLNVAGSGIIYSIYLGYYEDVQGLGIAVDQDLIAYVTGATGPNIEPTVTITPPNTPPPPFCSSGFQPSFGGSGGNEYGGIGTDGFIVKIDATASEMLYCSYLGGSDEDVAFGVAVDSHANAYLTGLTYSTDLPITNTATYTSPLAPLQGTYAGAGDAFLAKVNTNATGTAALLYSTYLGGTGLDQGNAVAVDSSGNAYVAGEIVSRASTLNFTPAGYQTDCALDSESVCEGDAFVAKFNPALSGANSLIYFTYLGGSLADSGAGIAVDTIGDAYVAGSTVSSNAALVPFPITGAVFQPTYGGGNADAFVAELNPAGTALVYATYLGGSGTDTASGIGIDTNGNAYVTGQTCSLDFPLVSPWQSTPGGNCDAFVSKIIPVGGVALVPAGLIFASQDLGTTSAAQTVMLTNGSSATLTITSIDKGGANPGDFAIDTSAASACSTTVPVAAQGSCTISVTFKPTSVTPVTRTARITVTDSGAGSPRVVDLTGTAGTAPIVALSASTLPFSTQQAVGVTSSPLALTVTNTGTAALTFTSVVATGDFAVASNNCTPGLQVTTPASNCTITVTFTPTVAGSSVGSLTLIDNAPDAPQIILLTGTGVALPAVTLSATSLAFGNQTVNLTSSAQTISVTNSGSGTLTVGTIAATAPFAETNSCTSVAPAGTCTISVTFTPTAAGLATGTLSIADNATGSPQTITLNGTGVAAPLASLSPNSLTYATEQALGTISSGQDVTLTNTGTAALTVTGIAASGDFAAATNSCGSSLAAGANCVIVVTFTPTAVGSRYGTLTVTDNSGGTAGSTQTVALEGTGQGGPVATLSASALSFGSQPLNTTSSLKSLTLTNSGTATMTGIGVAISGDFAQTNTCVGTLAASSSCTINVTFTPSVVGSRAGTLTITDSAPSSPQSVALSGTGADFSVAINPNSATVVAGNTTTITVSVSPVSGFASAVSLACSGLPSLATCSASPAAVTPTGTSAATSTLTVSTTRRTLLPPGRWPRPHLPGGVGNPVLWLVWALILLSLGAWATRRNRWRWSWVVLAAAMLWLASFAACGSGGTGYVNSTGTPSGTYTVTIAGTSGALTHSTSLTLTVQ